MRVIEPKKKSVKKNSRNTNSKSHVKIALIIVSLIVILPITYKIIFKSSDINENYSQEETITTQEIAAEVKIETIENKKTPAQFNGNEFNSLYDNLILKNTEVINEPPVITGDDVADARIRQIAEARGYKIRLNATEELTSINGYLLQEDLISQWISMQKKAASEGISMIIVSGFRTIDEQRELFLSRLIANGINVENISSGIYDDSINEVLSKASPPGYSKHHSGYTIDLRCNEEVIRRFKDSVCNDWLTNNNYENAREFGFIPSFPIDADLQGPDPEAWEYVYVGTQVLNYN